MTMLSVKGPLAAVEHAGAAGGLHTRVTIISKSAAKTDNLMHASVRHKHDGLTIPTNCDCIQEGDCRAYAVTSKQCEQ